jgi:hypothetical protein
MFPIKPVYDYYVNSSIGTLSKVSSSSSVSVVTRARSIASRSALGPIQAPINGYGGEGALTWGKNCCLLYDPSISCSVFRESFHRKFLSARLACIILPTGRSSLLLCPWSHYPNVCKAHASSLRPFPLLHPTQLLTILFSNLICSVL